MRIRAQQKTCKRQKTKGQQIAVPKSLLPSKMFGLPKGQTGTSQRFRMRKETIRVSTFYSFYETRKELAQKNIIFVMELIDLPPEIWCNVFDFIDFRELCLRTCLVSSSFFSYFCETRNKKYSEIFSKFEKHCGGVKNCNKFFFLGDLSVKNERTKAKEFVTCAKCGRNKKRNTKANFYFPILKESRFERFARLVEFVKSRVCAPGMYESIPSLEAYKLNVYRFLILVFGLRWAERNGRKFISLCEWKGRNAQLKLERCSNKK
ncbi:hypothetical protein [Brazilian marseillevirus]|uniref:hypothetical protein n=1 Tax=Brazilian marseillevirus TaxID=1813599 RepID=UPI00078650C6|nr:hypothetical protein A3303_gp476 [Brazilian marseillevirus]AMQ10984.1 hypothetical protein [Brazilian marseillevirus]